MRIVSSTHARDEDVRAPCGAMGLEEGVAAACTGAGISDCVQTIIDGS